MTASMTITIKAATWKNDHRALSKVRKKVFIEEQHVPTELEWDDEDDLAWHWLAETETGDAIGTARLLRSHQIGRMAVLPAYRHQGIGRQLLLAALDQAIKNDWFDVYLHAQLQAIDFYAKAGFIAEGPEFMDADIPHRTMRKILQLQRRIGKDHGKIKITDLRDSIEIFAQQTHRDLMILSNALDSEFFDSETLANNLSQLARNHRSASIRLLVINSKKLTGQLHKLIALYRRLPTSIQLRVVAEENSELINEGFMVADRSGVLVFALDNNQSAWADFNNRPLANQYTELFERYWQSAQEDPNLRALTL
jgi:predicted GNAT family N-acyltransferase